MPFHGLSWSQLLNPWNLLPVSRTQVPTVLPTRQPGPCNFWPWLPIAQPDPGTPQAFPSSHTVPLHSSWQQARRISSSSGQPRTLNSGGFYFTQVKGKTPPGKQGPNRELRSEILLEIVSPVQNPQATGKGITSMRALRRGSRQGS